MNQRITGDQEQQGHSNANQSRTQADDEGFRVEHLGYIPLGRANGAKDADLFFSLQHTDIGDHTDHDGGDHQGNCHKGNQHIADGINDFRHGRHHGSHQVGIADHLFLLAAARHAAVVGP